MSVLVDVTSLYAIFWKLEDLNETPWKKPNDVPSLCDPFVENSNATSKGHFVYPLLSPLMGYYCIQNHQIVLSWPWHHPPSSTFPSSPSISSGRVSISTFPLLLTIHSWLLTHNTLAMVNYNTSMITHITPMVTHETVMITHIATWFLTKQP